jgi:hypothetical protein
MLHAEKRDEMGYYVNPRTESKEQFLAREGRSISPKWGEQKPDETIVVLIDNGFFTAAGIAYDEKEFQAFTSPTDNRPKTFYAVNTDKLRTVSDMP